MNATQIEAGIFGWETLVKDISRQFKFANQVTTDNLLSSRIQVLHPAITEANSGKVSSYTVKLQEVTPLLGNYQGGWNLA